MNLLTLPTYLFEKLMPDPNSGCWLWTGSLDQAQGYGRVKARRSRRVDNAHRHVWEVMRGPVPEGLVVDHKCRNRACCNPEHMRLMTHRENILAGTGAASTALARDVCVNGHPFDYVRFGGRRCRKCEAASAMRYYEKNKERVNARRRKQ